MQLGADPDYLLKDRRGRMLDKALTSSKEQLTLGLETLLAGGADPNRRDNRGKAPLNRALYGRSRLEKVQMLVRYGADIHTMDNCGKTLLWSALTVRANQHWRSRRC